MLSSNTSASVFEGGRRLAAGNFAEVAPAYKLALDRADASATPKRILIIDNATSEFIEFDWRGTVDDVRTRIASLPDGAAPSADNEHDDAAGTETARGRGRPKLGVVPREVTLLPRHWEWLSRQSGGASVALRKLVETASRASREQDEQRATQQVAYKFMSLLAGNEAGFEEASRALFAGDVEGVMQHAATWPADVRLHLEKLLGTTAKETA